MQKNSCLADEQSLGFGQTNRRDFLRLTGLGLVFCFTAAGSLSRPLAAFAEEASPFASDLNAYLHIAPNGRVTGYVGKIEMGQGSKTSLAQCLAEELDVSLDSVDMVLGDTDLCPFDIGTFGSLGIGMYAAFVRGAAAEARAVLLQMASEKLQVPVEKLQVKEGVVSVAGNPGKHISYGKLVEGQRIERHIANVPMKTGKGFKVMGTSAPRKDGLEKVTGKAKYTADLAIPGTVHARMVRPPAHGATLKSIDTSAAEKAGAKIVRDGDFVAVIHERPDLADKALALVKSEWDRPQTGIDDKTIFAHLSKFAPQLALLKAKGNLEEGEKLVAASLEKNGAVFERTYLNSYVYHATLETHTAIAKLEDGKATVWASTQIPFPMKDEVAKLTGLPPQKVRVIAGPYIGGGFGGKGQSVQEALEAVRIAKLLGNGKPVQLVWDRAEDIFYNNHRPAAVVNIRSGLTGKAKIAFWEFKVFGAGQWEALNNYDIPNQRTSWVGYFSSFRPNPKGMQPLLVGPWRAPSAITNIFATESHIDEMAFRAGVDPAEFRFQHLETDKRQKRVLQAALKQFGYQPPAKSPGGRGIGIACGKFFESYVACVAQVEVDKNTGAVQVKRVVDAVDAGFIVNPEGTRQQVESCITMGIGSALTEEVHFRDGEVLDRNFDSYHIPRFSWIPKMEAVLVENPELPHLGVGGPVDEQETIPLPPPIYQHFGIGEPPIVVVGAALANAIFDAVGARVRQFPMTPARVKEALRETLNQA